MGLNRVQLSLLIPDADLYEELVLPLKNSRELAPLIIRMLSVYYKDESVRNVVDGFSDSLETATDTESAAAKQSKNFKAVADVVSMYNILTEELTSIAENGIDDMVSRMNDIATASGGEVSQDSDFGMSMPTFGNALPDLLAAKQAEASQTVGAVNESESTIGKGTVADIDAIVSATVDKKMEAMNSELNTQKQTLNSIQTMLQQLLKGNTVASTVAEAEQTTSVPESIVQDSVEEVVSTDADVVVEEQEEEVVAPPPSLDIDMDLFSDDTVDTTQADTTEDVVESSVEDTAEEDKSETNDETETLHDKDSLLDFISEGGAFSFNIT